MASSPTPSPFALDIAERQYLHKDREGNLKEDWDGMLRRVSRHVAKAEALEQFKQDHGEYPMWYQQFDDRKNTLRGEESLEWFIKDYGYEDLVKKWEDRFYELIASKRFMPAGRILAGSASRYGQLQNCFVLESNGRHIPGAAGDPDSIDGIYELAYKLAKVTKTGGGCGIFLGHLRESGSFVEGSGGSSSGPVSFLRLLYATTLRVIKLEGVRRGAGMATLPIHHPDALDFLTAKDKDREDLEGKIESFNISFLLTDEFMEAVENDDLWAFISVRTGEATPPTPVLGKYHLPGQTPTSVSGNPKDPATSQEIPLEDGKVPARWLLETIAAHAQKTGDPGAIFIDTINKYWPMEEHLGPIKATNPCGEEPLAAGESCDLGALVLSNFVDDKGRIHFKDIQEAAFLATRFLDNVLTISAHPIEDTEEMCDALRRVGLGVMGDADMMARAGVAYDSPEADRIRERVADSMKRGALNASRTLAMERGEFPLFEKSELLVPRRNIHMLTIAPTGTTSMISDVASGIEPVFALGMMRRVGDDYKFRFHPTFEEFIRRHVWDIDLDDESVHVEHEVVIRLDRAGNPVTETAMVHPVVKAIMDNNGSVQGLDEFLPREQQKLFKTAHDVDPECHLRVQAVWQKALDDAITMPMSSISKTINCPHDTTAEDVYAIFVSAYKHGVKGVTVYRDGSRGDQVLRTDSGEDEEEDNECPVCDDGVLVQNGGCEECQVCGFSKCSI